MNDATETVHVLANPKFVLASLSIYDATHNFTTSQPHAMLSMPPQALAQMAAQMGGAGGGGAGGAGGAPPGGHVIQLTAEEMESVNRLTALGFDRNEAAQAFLACDKNEALAANLLMDGGFGAMDDGAFGGGGGAGGGGGGGAGGDPSSDMYD